ncbi:MAG: hypothetical protein KKF12_17250 [Proteobacteria bacterium]|nr:hypothetical protein [Desulfobacula sp.]MBU4132565.1 hypothetical protein [Pseudomonadota bacterium]
MAENHKPMGIERPRRNKMHKEIKKRIQSMDVKKDREDAHIKAQEIYQMGPEAMDVLVELGRGANADQGDLTARTRLIRGIIFSLSKFAKKRLFRKPRLFKNPDALDLLCEFSAQEFNSARTLLHQVDFSDTDILKRILMSLPVVDKRDNDREVTLGEAVLEINYLEPEYRVKKIQKQGYIIGIQDKYAHGIFRTGKNSFAYRIRRV